MATWIDRAIRAWQVGFVPALVSLFETMHKCFSPGCASEFAFERPRLLWKGLPYKVHWLAQKTGIPKWVGLVSGFEKPAISKRWFQVPETHSPVVFLTNAFGCGFWGQTTARVFSGPMETPMGLPGRPAYHVPFFIVLVFDDFKYHLCADCTENLLEENQCNGFTSPLANMAASVYLRGLIIELASLPLFKWELNPRDCGVQSTKASSSDK